MRRLGGLGRLAARNVFRNGRRSAFALATIGMGGLGLFVFMGFNRGIMNQYKANTIRARWGHGILTTAGYRDHAHAEPWKAWIDRPDAALAAARRLPGVRRVFPRAGLSVLLVNGTVSIGAIGEGVDGPEEAAFFDQLNYIAGVDLHGTPDGIVLGKGLAEGLGIGVGDRLDLVARDVHGAPRMGEAVVTGIFHTGSQEYDSRSFRIQLKLAQRLLGTGRLESISVALDGTDAWPAFAVASGVALPGLSAVPFDELDRVYYRHAVDWLDAQFAFIRTIILVVVFLGIFNVISMAVVERTVEIGVLRANGETRAEVAAGQIGEAALLGVCGGILGVLAGLALTFGPLAAGVEMPPAPGITRSFRIMVELARGDAWQVIGLCTLTATAGAIWPVVRALRLPIAAALRHV